jgi:hypothetical protein
MKIKMQLNEANFASLLRLRKTVVGSALLFVMAGLQGVVFANSVPAGNKPTPDPSPYERRVALPDLFILPPGQKQSFRFEPKSFRMSMICLLGSWNKQSLKAHRFFEKHKVFFKERKVATIAAFSHDTEENLTAWVQTHKPSYVVGLAQTEFVDLLKNPKVPTCWVLSHQGQLLKQLVSPTNDDLESIYQNLKLWTDF